MPDILIQPATDNDDDPSNVIILNDTTLPANSQDAEALGLTLGVTYKFRVLGEIETFSVAVPATAPAQMNAPTVTATGANSISVDLAAAPSDGGSVITFYDLRYSTDETNWIVVSDVSDPETVSGLTADTLYYVQTRAVNGIDVAPWSTSGSATTSEDLPELPAISSNASNTVDITLDDGMFSITVSGAEYPHHNGTFGPFNTADFSGGAIMLAAPVMSGNADFDETLMALPGLWIYPSNDPVTTTGEWISGGVGTGDTDLQYQTSSSDEADVILYRESVTNTAGTRSADSNSLTMPVLPTAPAQMSAPVLTVNGARRILVDLASAPADGGSAITEYDIRYSTDESTWTVVSDVTDPVELTDLASETLFYVQTRAVNAVGDGLWSASASATTDVSNVFEYISDFENDAPVGTLMTDMPEYGAAGGNTNLVMRDSGGVRVARTEVDGIAIIAMDGPEFVGLSGSREMSVTVHKVADAGTQFFYPYFVGSVTYLRMSVGAGGTFGMRQQVDGSNDINIGYPAGTVQDGDVITTRIDGSNVTQYINGVQIGPVRTLAPTPFGPPRMSLGIAAGYTIPWEFSQIAIKEVE